MKGRLKGAWILSLLLAGLFQPNLGQEQQEILTGLQLSHQHDEARSCLRTQPIPDRAKVDCYDSVQGSAHDYGALSLSGQYVELNALQTSLGIDRLVILGFPCNQFGKQEPGQNSEILQGIKHIRPGGGFVPNFQLFQKGDVNGENEQRIYTFLKNSCPPVVESFGDPAKLFWSPMKIHDIKWNFEKFLVNPQGKPVMRWFQRTNVSSVKNDIIRYMKKNG
ncbi:glutathione peroxidase 3 [Crotalus adamanteus]|uniref:Glutathione peroxidase n=1 Tax=Crotalus adamanteus TaxID=8729 RepID=A0AAW1BWT8_CROAD